MEINHLYKIKREIEEILSYTYKRYSPKCYISNLRIITELEKPCLHLTKDESLEDKCLFILFFEPLHWKMKLPIKYKGISLFYGVFDIRLL